jgi:riboflavin kinase/FMN adenylyltransferase
VGVNPTFQENGAVSVETHILEFDDLIYGEEIKVEFIRRLRAEKKFKSVEDLKTQMQQDVQTAQRILDEDAEVG